MQDKGDTESVDFDEVIKAIKEEARISVLVAADNLTECIMSYEEDGRSHESINEHQCRQKWSLSLEAISMSMELEYPAGYYPTYKDGKAILNAIYRAYQDKNPKLVEGNVVQLSYREIYDRMPLYEGKRITDKMKNSLLLSLGIFRQCFIKSTVETKKGSYSIEGQALVNSSVMKIEYRGRTVERIKIYAVPPILKYASSEKHIKRYKVPPDGYGLRMSTMNNDLVDYVGRVVCGDKKFIKENVKTVLIDTVFKNCGINPTEDRKKKLRALISIETILEAHKGAGDLVGYKINTDSGRIYLVYS